MAFTAIHKTRTRAGHSLLEMLFACMIFATVVIITASVWTWYGRSVAASSYVLVASQLGEELMEQCVGAGYHKVDSLATPGDEVREITLRTIMRDQVVEVVYTCRVQVKKIASEPLKQVLVEITWDDENGPEAVRFETLLFLQE